MREKEKKRKKLSVRGVGEESSSCFESNSFFPFRITFPLSKVLAQSQRHTHGKSSHSLCLPLSFFLSLSSSFLSFFLSLSLSSSSFLPLDRIRHLSQYILFWSNLYIIVADQMNDESCFLIPSIFIPVCITLIDRKARRRIIIE